ncbi:MAG TPA: hypothetical protein VD838_10490, partial [Anaeromyxobacteraceae bacterium]|nr:hypothetical protein [Anaeromyxobacteraceae bacterium]
HGFSGTVVQDVLERHNLKPMHDKMVQDMRNRHERAAKAHVRTDARHFKDVAKRQKRTTLEECPIRPLEDADGNAVGDTNGNGTCDGDEECASVLDFTVKCNPQAKPGKKGECARICVGIDEPLAPAAGSEEEEVAESLLKSYDDMDATLAEMNTALAQLPPTEDAVFATLAAGGACANLSETPEALETAAKVLKIADVALEGAAKIAGSLCGQDVVVVGVAMGFGGGGGGNASVACTVVETASAVASTASAVVEIALEFLRDDVEAATFACLQKTVEDVAGVRSTVEETAGALETRILALEAGLAEARAALDARIGLAERNLDRKLDTAMSEARAQYLELWWLLNTPAGRREGFPTSPE